MIEKHINPVFGETLEEQLDASPITFIDDFNTPMLMISENYTYPFTELFEKALSKKKFDKFMVLNFHNESHGSLWKKLSNEEDCIYRNYIGDYIKSRVK